MGIENQADWERSYEGDAGGIITVQSELGEPIHVIRNKCSELWREFDQRFFGNRNPKEMLAALKANKEEVISRLNEAYQKPWFGKKLDGRAVDLGEMTYEEVCLRLAEVGYYPGDLPDDPTPRWFDVTFRDRVHLMLVRTEERFCGVEKPAFMKSSAQLEKDPQGVIKAFFDEYPRAREVRIWVEDADYFISDICMNPRRKPINFVPRIDESFKRYFKVDSLWYSEDLASIPGRDMQKALIIHGPVAAKFTMTKQETISDVLNGVTSVVHKHALDAHYGGQMDKVPAAPCLDLLQAQRVSSPAEPFADTVKGDVRTVVLADKIPSMDAWVSLLCEENGHLMPGARWLYSLLTSPTIVRGDRRAPNMLRNVLAPMAYSKTTLEVSDGRVHKVSVSLLAKSSKDDKDASADFHNVSISYDDSSKDILTNFNFHVPVSGQSKDNKHVSLRLHFVHRPDMVTAPIHEIVDGHNEAVRKFYSKVWLTSWDAAQKKSEFTFLPSHNLNDDEVFIGFGKEDGGPMKQVWSQGVLNLPAGSTPKTDFTHTESFSVEQIQRFCDEVGHHHRIFIEPSKLPVLPMDFAIVAGWHSLIQSVINDDRLGSVDLLRLLHLENRFKLLRSRRMLNTVDSFSSNFSLVEITNTPTGKRCTGRGLVSHEGVPWVVVTSTFFVPWSITTSAEEAKSVGQPMQIENREYFIVLNDEMMDVVKAKPYFQFSKDVPAFQDGDVLQVVLTSVDEWKADQLCCNAEGTLHLRRGNADPRTVGSVSYHAKEVKGNALLSFLTRVATEQPPYKSLDAPYRLLPEPDVAVAPVSCARYSMASNDRNPIHTDAVFARLGGLEEPIVHGMWLSANASRVVLNSVGKPEYFRCQFVNKVRPGAKIYTQLTHVGMREGLCSVEFECVDDEGSVVVKGVADAIQRTTATVFTGQGSATKGMGMDLYAASESARTVWDRADKHFLKTYGLSLLEIVRENPTSKTVYFGGVAGSHVRASLRKMTKSVVGKDGVVREAPLFPEISEQSMSHTFMAPKGLLFATQFAQPCQVILALTQYNEMKEKLLLSNTAMFAGHSLGEYAAIAAVTGNDLFDLEDLMDLMFMRGMTMQQVVKRNSKQQSDYGMVAVDPTRVAKDCTPQFIFSVVKHLEQMILKTKAGALLQIVNYNVEPTQYVVAGDRLSLHAFMHVCDALKKVTTAQKVKVSEVPPDTIMTAVQAAIRDVKAVPNGDVLELVRGKATIPLEGIDVPFHSKLLLSEVPHFRKLLQAKFKVCSLSSMIGRYVPNLVGRPFSFSKDFAEMIFASTKSPVIQQQLPSWEHAVKNSPDELGRMLVIELLAYQFAFPVLWIETTDFLLRESNVTKVIELGPGPVLKNMLRVALDKNPRFLALRSEIVNLSYAADEKKLFFRLKDQGVTAGEASAANMDRSSTNDVNDETPEAVAEATTTAAVSAPPPAAAAPVIQVATAIAASGGPEVDVPPKAFDALRIILANRLGKPVDAIPEAATIKQLSGGKSALQNEIVGELGKEFDGDSDNAAEQPLSALASAIGASYKKLGGLTTNMLDRVVKDKLPAGTSISSLRNTLKSEYMLSADAVEGVLLRAIANAPAARLEEAAASAWRASIVAKFADDESVSVGRRGSGEGGAGAGASQVVAAMDPKMASKLKHLAARINEAYMDFLDDSSAADMRASLTAQKDHSTALEKRHAALIAEVGEVFEAGVQPLFDVRKVRQYTHWWAVAKMNAVEFIEDLAAGKFSLDSRQAKEMLFRLGNCMTSALKDLLLHSAKDFEKDGFQEMAGALRTTANTSRSGFFTSRDQPVAPQTSISAEGKIVYKDIPRPGEETMLDYVAALEKASKDSVPPVSMQRTDADAELGQSAYDAQTTKAYFDTLRQLVSDGISFKGKVAFISGVSPGSITEPIVGALLEGGCTVIVSTRLQSTNFSFFQNAYERHCGAGSRLIVVPFNQASVGDVDRALEYIYAAPDAGGLGLDVDFCFPFAALSENGRGIGEIDSKSELAHRIMLTNVLRMTGKVKNLKQERHLLGRTTLFVVPMSPNHGVFGSDGLYAESKLGLESLFHKWHSEALGDYISVVGAVIGWTRGTSLMSANNVVADHMESLGCRCFSSGEMAFNLMGLLHPAMLNECQVRPIHANLTGGMQAVANLSEKMAMRRQQLSKESRIATAVLKDNKIDAQIESAGGVANAESQARAANVYPRCCPNRASSRVFPLPTKERLERLRDLEGMVDPASVVVVTGFGEVGPWGGSFTRWEMEAEGEFSIEGCMRMAWLMGLVKYFDGRLVDPEGRPFMYSGWVDVASGQPVKDWEIKKRYESQILAHSGIRVWEKELFWDYQPQEGSKFYHCVVLDESLKAVEVPDQETAEQFKQMHCDQCEIYTNDGVWFVQLQKGAKMYIPRALRRDRWVAGQVPTGWDPKRFGVPDDIINQVDRGTLFTMVAFVEALMAAGITDPYEFYEYVHFSKVGNAVGSGIGGTHALRQMFFDSKMGDAPRVQGDILQETFVNTTAAWLNLLFLSSCGPIKTPVGACATAVESVSIGFDAIRTGQAKVMVVGAYDDLNEESSVEFANMKATSNTETEIANGRNPGDMCRPMSSTRAGFMESHGAGVMLLMSGDLALQMGVPICAVVAMAHTATDSAGRSVPAPGKGLLSAVAEDTNASRRSPLLSLGYRRKQLESELAGLVEWKRGELQALQTEAQLVGKEADEDITALDEEYDRLVSAARRRWGTDWADGHASISPMRAALAVWGLTANDIAMASCHGTSTKLNDKNESDLLNTEMTMLGRSKGDPMYVVTQKWLTGHPKGPAAAWQLAGAMQAMMTSIVPGNRNLDDTDPTLEQFEHLMYTNRTLRLRKYFEAVSVTSFGFGQAGGQVLLVHPDRFLATLPQTEFDAYAARWKARRGVAFQRRQDVLSNRVPLVQVKEGAPYEAAKQAIMNLMARTSVHDKAGEAKPAEREKVSVDASVQSAISKALGSAGAKSGVGVDVERFDLPCFGNETFLARNFTPEELRDCELRSAQTGHARRPLCGLWAGKEAVLKALGNAAGGGLRGGGAAIRDVVLRRPAGDGPVAVELNGEAAALAKAAGISSVSVTLSYTEELAVAAAVANQK
eukprot:TRINITY_DN4943_c0_g1_i9.p1 TRINITY_DN4943_c0_g1~~TRINITY_DN4943_c0_g1_i9.p1  ORF type:complete len:3436 (-),score=625.04 TRINITY_DN4943_c0_g1_i9:83-9400(-)